MGAQALARGRGRSVMRAPAGHTVVLVLAFLSSTVLAQRLGPRVTRDGVSVRFLAGAEIQDIDLDGAPATVQRVGDVAVRLVRGEAYRGYARGQSSSARVCGRPATRLVLDVPAVEAIPGFIDDQGRYSHGPPSITPARLEISLRFEHRGRPFLVTWVVPPSRRARHRATEQAFFASIRCE